MKKLSYLIVVILIFSLVLTGCSLLSNVGQVPVTEQTKVKPTGTGNLAGAEEVPWNLSRDVMPVPPYGSCDIPNSDMLSKLIVNQPNGNTEVTITGVMKGLHPYTTYTVILSYGYTPYVAGWDVNGSYVINVEYLGIDYPENLVLVQSGTEITGVSLALLSGASPWTINAGTVDENIIDFYGSYDANPAMEIHFFGTIDTDGSMSGCWEDVAPRTRSGAWASTKGVAVDHTGDTSHPGDFYDYPRFTFLTDEDGAVSWHLNLRDEDFNGARDYTLSVWINVNEPWRTILISNTFDVIVD
jgi:hypothetical protein